MSDRRKVAKTDWEVASQAVELLVIMQAYKLALVPDCPRTEVKGVPGVWGMQFALQTDKEVLATATWGYVEQVGDGPTFSITVLANDDDLNADGVLEAAIERLGEL